MGLFDNNPSSSPAPQPIDKSRWIFDPFGDDKDDEDDQKAQSTAKQRALDSIRKGFDSKLGL